MIRVWINRKSMALFLVFTILFSSYSFLAERTDVAAAENTNNGEENLLSNGSFEEVDDQGWASAWGRWTPVGNPQFTVDDTVSKEGTRSLKISADVTSRGSANQRFDLTDEQRGKTYRLQQWVRTEDFTGTAYFRIQVYADDGTRLDYIETERIREANDWTLIEMEVILSQSAALIHWDTFYENGTGTVWYDDIRFYEINPRELIRNGGFEEVNTNGLPMHWGRSTFTGSPVYSVDETVARSGSRSAKISAETSSRGVFNQDIMLQQGHRGKSYRIEQWLRTEDFTGSAYFRLQVYDEDGNRLDYIESSRIYEADDWTLVELEVFLSEQAVRILWDTFYEHGTGTVWYDDTRFFEIESGKRNLIRNGGFEYVRQNGLPDQWTTASFTGSPVYSVDETIARSGLRSAKIHAETSSRGALVQRVNLYPELRGKDYRIEQWMRMEDFTGTAYFRIQVYDEEDNRIDYVESDRIYEAEDWVLVEMEVSLREDAVRVLWEAFYEHGTGTVWYDDTHFYEHIPVLEVTLDPQEIQLQPGESKQLVATLIPENASDQEVSWKSSDEAVITVDEGQITAQNRGIAAVTAKTRNGVKADSIVIVGEVSGIIVPDYESSVEQGRYVTGNIEAISEAEDPITYAKLTDPDKGIVQVAEDGQWTYYANDDYTGNDHFYVVVRDESGNWNKSKVTLDILPVYLAPELQEVIQPTDKNTAVDGEMIVIQPNGEELTFQIEEYPSHGQTVIDSLTGNWTYTPNPDHIGNDTFTVHVENEHGKHAVTNVRVYTAPSAEEIIHELKANNTDQRHPRLLAAEEDFTRIRTLLENQDPRMTEWFSTIQSSADALLSVPPFEYVKPDGLRLSTTSAGRIATLAFVYQITEDSAYAERAWEEIEFVSSDAYPDWSHGHFLDTAAMTHGVALGYDWLYDFLTEERRSITRQAIAEKGLTPAVPMYVDKTYWWVYNRDNWNFVCNAGMVLGALAIADEEEELAGLILREAFKSIQYGLPQYAPDGSAIEGPGYWEYGTSYLVYFLSALETSFGHDFGFSEADGIAETPMFPIYVTGPKGSFNYSDNSDAHVNGRLLLWFANRFNKPEYTWHHQFAAEHSVNPGLYDMIWYRPETYGATEPAHLDRYFERPKAVTMRSNWNDPNALFVGFKGGVNGAPHGHLDTGSFVFDANGVRWALDLGAESYNLPYSKWHLYRNMTEGHNTLAIQSNTSLGFNQKTISVSEITRTEFDRPEGSFAIADLTPAYKDSAASVKRGTALLNHRREFLVQDEIQLKSPTDVYWFMHTRAQIELDEAGTTAVLSQEGRQLAVQLVSPADASFSVLPAEPLPGSRNPDGQRINHGVKKLAVHLEKLLESTITVRMVPLMPGESLSEAPAVVSLDAWHIEVSELALLDQLTVNGEALASFEPTRYVYDINVQPEDQVPVVEAHAAGGYEVTIHQSDQLPGITRIEVKDPNAFKESTVYYIVFRTPAEAQIPEGLEPVIPIAVDASTHDGNVPENTLDGDLDTRWSAEGEQWIQYDLGETTNLSAVAIAWYQGNVRQSYFHIEMSEDGEQWITVHEGISSGETVDLELTMIDETPARYVRILGFGNSQNRWNSISEVLIYQTREEPVFDSVTDMLEAVEGSREEFTTEQAYRAVRTHLSALQHYESQGDMDKVLEHMGGLVHLLDYQHDHGLISSSLYDLLSAGASAIIDQ